MSLDEEEFTMEDKKGIGRWLTFKVVGRICVNRFRRE